MPYMPKVKAAASHPASILMNRMRASAASTNATPAAAGL